MYYKILAFGSIILAIFVPVLFILYVLVKPVIKKDVEIECIKLYDRIVRVAKFGNAYGLDDFRSLVKLSRKYNIRLSEPRDKSDDDLANIAVTGLEEHLRFTVRCHRDFYTPAELDVIRKDLEEFKKAWGIE